MKKEFIETVINAIPDILNNSLSWAKDNFDKHAQEVLGSASGTVGIMVKLLGQSLIDKYFEKQTVKRLENFGLQIYFKAAFEQANRSIEAIQEELQNEVSTEEVKNLFDLIITEQIDSFDSKDILLIFRPKYHPAVLFVKKNFLRILECLDSNIVSINAFKKHFNDHIEGQISKEFGDDYEKHLEETEQFRLKDNETDFLWDMIQLSQIGFKETEYLKYEQTFAQWTKVSEFREQDRENIGEIEIEKREQTLQPIEVLIDEYFSNQSDNHLAKILFIVTDFGKGKSVFLKQYAARLARNYLNTGDGAFPIYFNLRNFKNYSSEPKLGVISDFLQTKYGIKIDNEYFQKKQYVFLIDSLDESGELSKTSIDKVISSIKRVQGINKEKYRTNQIIITSRPIDEGLETHLRSHSPHIIKNKEGRDIEHFISIYGFKKAQFNDWLLDSLSSYEGLNEIRVTEFTKHIFEAIKQQQVVDVYAKLLRNRTLSQSELRRPIFAYMIYQLILNNINFSAIGKIGVYLSFLNLLTKEAKHIHDTTYRVNLKEEFSFRNILHATAALWVYERQQGKQGTLKKSDICRMLDNENKGETDEQILERYKNQGIVEIQFLSHSYFGVEENTLYFQHQSFAEILLAEYYLKVFIKYALDEEFNIEEARTKLILGLPTDQTMQFFRELLQLLRETATEEITDDVLEKRKLLFPVMASLATRKHNRLFCNEVFYEWYKRCPIEDNQTEYSFESLKIWSINRKKIEKILELAKEILESKTNYFLTKAESKSSLYDKEILVIQNNKLSNFPPDIDRWLALLVGNELFNDFSNEKQPKLFNWEFKVNFAHLFDLVRNWNYAFYHSVPSWGKTLFKGIDMSQNKDTINLPMANLDGIDFSYSYLKEFQTEHAFLSYCDFSYVTFENVNFSFSTLFHTKFTHINSIKGRFELECTRLTPGVFMPYQLCRKFSGIGLFGNHNSLILKERYGNPTEVFYTLKGILIYGYQNQLFTFSEVKTWFQFESEKIKEEFFQMIDELKKV